MHIENFKRYKFVKKAYGDNAVLDDFDIKLDLDAKKTCGLYLETYNNNGERSGLLSGKIFLQVADFGVDVRNSNWYHTVLVSEFHAGDFTLDIENSGVYPKNKGGRFGFRIPGCEYKRARRTFLYQYVKNRIIELPNAQK